MNSFKMQQYSKASVTESIQDSKMNSMKVFFCFALVAAANANPSGYEFGTSHDQRPVQEYQEEHQAEYQHVGQESYGHGDGGESHGDTGYAHIELGYGHEDAGSSHGGSSHDDDSHHKHPDHHPSYKYEYGATDPKTGHQHSAWEHRDGDVVHGEYSLDEADGTKRIVKYTSDKKNGYNAVVERIGEPHYDHSHQEEHHH